MTRIAYIGNFRPDRSTENALTYGLEANGCHIIRCQQETVRRQQPLAWARGILRQHVDLVLYTRTHNTTALGADWTRAWRELERHGTRTASFHLDTFVGLRREGIRPGRYHHEPLFTTQTVCTPDIALEAELPAGSRHVWMPPAADVRDTDPDPEPIPELAGRIVFVGSRYGTGRTHPEYPRRAQLLDWLTSHYRERFVWVGPGSPCGAVRGKALWDIYASNCEIVGDSCFALDGTRPYYWSDRVPETLARGGLLLHPTVDGLKEQHPDLTMFDYDGPGPFDGLGAVLDSSPTRNRTADSYPALAQQRLLACRHTRQHHTYTHRARQLLEETDLQ